MGRSENLLGTIVIIFICDNRPKTLDKYGTKRYEHCKVKLSQLRRSVMVRKSVSSTTRPVYIYAITSKTASIAIKGQCNDKKSVSST